MEELEEHPLSRHSTT